MHTLCNSTEYNQQRRLQAKLEYLWTLEMFLRNSMNLHNYSGLLSEIFVTFRPLLLRPYGCSFFCHRYWSLVWCFFFNWISFFFLMKKYDDWINIHDFMNIIQNEMRRTMILSPFFCYVYWGQKFVFVHKFGTQVLRLFGPCWMVFFIWKKTKI